MGLENQGHIEVLRDEIAQLQRFIKDPHIIPSRRADFEIALKRARANLRREEAKP